MVAYDASDRRTDADKFFVIVRVVFFFVSIGCKVFEPAFGEHRAASFPFWDIDSDYMQVKYVCMYVLMYIYIYIYPVSV